MVVVVGTAEDSRIVAVAAAGQKVVELGTDHIG